MSEEKTHTAREEAGEAIPRTRVLAYLTNEAATATRVRKVSAVALRVIAVPFLILATIECLLLAGLAWEIWTLYSYYAASPPYVGSPYSSSYYGSPSYLVSRYLAWVLWLLFGIIFSGLPSVVLLWRAGAVRRGQSWSSKLCAAALWPLALHLLFAAALSGAAALYIGLGVYRMSAQPMYLLWFIGTAAAGFLTLVVWDVRAYLRWIARNPQEEKPAVAFLPRVRDVEVARGG